MSPLTDDRNAQLGQVLRALRRRWWIVIACVVFTGGAAILFSTRQVKQYTASASLLFQDPGFDQMVFGSNFAQPTADPTRQAATNIDLVSLPTVAARTSRALGGKITPGRVRAEVSVAASGQADIASISATDSSPVEAAVIANTYAKQYIRYRQQADRAKVAGAQTSVRHDLAQLTPSQRTSAVGQSLLNRANQLQILASLQTGNAELAQAATTPTSPSSPKTERNGIIGILVGLMLGLAIALLVDRFDQRLRDSAAVEEAYAVPILGVVPASGAFAASHANDPLQGAEAEAFGLLRARLRYFNVDRELRSILVTSAMPNDGKTTIALHLAIADAIAGARVVLVEADLRRPTLAERLDLRKGPGLADVVSRNVTLESALVSVGEPDFGPHGSGSHPVIDVLPAGAIPPNPAEMIESASMRELLVTLTEQYDIVIIDSPPVSVVADAIPLMRQVSGLVIVSRIGQTSRGSAEHLRQQLVKLNAPTLGVIANGERKRRGGYYDYANGYSDAEPSSGPREPLNRSSSAEPVRRT